MIRVAKPGQRARVINSITGQAALTPFDLHGNRTSIVPLQPWRLRSWRWERRVVINGIAEAVLVGPDLWPAGDG